MFAMRRRAGVGNSPMKGRLSAVRLIEALLTQLHRPRVPNLMNMQAKVLRDCAKLAQSIPVYACRAPNAMLAEDIDAPVAVVRALLDEEFVS
jgi:hypothetical protein